jgi:hypothetical protein
MSKLLLALPLPRVGALTLARLLAKNETVQAIAYYDFVIDDLAEDFGVTREFLIEHMKEPSNELTLMRHGPEARADAKMRRDDFFTARSTGFHIKRYLGEMRFSDHRIARMLRAVNDTERSLVFFNVNVGYTDIVYYQTYAKETGRQFALIDLTRSGVKELADRRYRFEGGLHVDNPEGRPQEAANELIKLATQ